MQVLTVEPDTLLANTYSQALSAIGHQARTARTAQGAIDAVNQSQPDMIVLELQLVSHSGIEFLYELRSYADWQGIPVIVLSNVPSTEFRGNLNFLETELGVLHYLYKPATSLVKLCRLVSLYQPAHNSIND